VGFRPHPTRTEGEHHARRSYIRNRGGRTDCPSSNDGAGAMTAKKIALGFASRSEKMAEKNRARLRLANFKRKKTV